MTSQSSKKKRVWRVFLVEDNPVVRRAYHLLLSLQPDMEVCGEAEDADEAFALIHDLRPDLAVVDLALRQSRGLELIVQLHVECPQVRLLVVSMHDQAHWIESALRAGAHGYVTKDECVDQLIRAIRQVLGGERFLSRRVLARLGGQRGPDRAGSRETEGPLGSPKAPPAALGARKRASMQRPPTPPPPAGR